MTRVSTARGFAWPAPAKLNLFLHVTGRWPDGYHLLQTLFQFLDFGDELYFTPRGDGVITRRLLERLDPDASDGTIVDVGHAYDDHSFLLRALGRCRIVGMFDRFGGCLCRPPCTLLRGSERRRDHEEEEGASEEV